MGLFSRKAPTPRDPYKALTGDGSYSFNVVGESRHMESLRALIARAPADQQAAGQVVVRAYLAPGAEPPEAIHFRVFVDGLQVGAVTRSRTSDFMFLWEQAISEGYEGLACWAVIGWYTQYADPLIGVRLDVVL